MKKMALVVAFSAVLGACSLLPKTASGTYQGVLPCADCDKIQAELILNADNSYQYNTVYFKDGKEHPFSDKGTFTWDKTKSDVIRLEKESGNLAFKVSNNKVEICDANGETVKTPNNPYVLQKVK